MSLEKGNNSQHSPTKSGILADLTDILQSQNIAPLMQEADLYWEAKDIISPNSSQGRLIDSRMRSMAEELLPGWDFADVSFVVVDNDEINAHYNRKNASGEYIAITKGAIDFCQTEDEVIVFIAHELGHWYRYHRVGDGHNTRGEEIFSEVRLMSRMVDAGRNPEAVYLVIDRLQQKGLIRQIEEIFDVHGSSQSRTNIIKNALIYVKKKKGLLPEKTNLNAIDPLKLAKIQYSFPILINEISGLDTSKQDSLITLYCGYYFSQDSLNWNKKNILLLDQYLANRLQDNSLTKSTAKDFYNKIPPNVRSAVLQQNVSRYNQNIVTYNFFPLTTKHYLEYIKSFTSTDDFIERVAQVPVGLRFQPEFCSVIYSLLRGINDVVFIDSQKSNINTMLLFTSLFDTTTENMCSVRCKKQFEKSIDSFVVTRGFSIVDIIKYTKQRDASIKNIFKNEDIIYFLKKGLDSKKITLQDIIETLPLFAIHDQDREDVELAIGIKKEIAVARNEVNISKKVSRVKLHASDKPQALQNACTVITQKYPQNIDGGVTGDGNLEVKILGINHAEISRDAMQLLKYYNSLLQIDDNHRLFIYQNLQNFLYALSCRTWEYDSWCALVNFIINHKQDIPNEILDSMLDSIGIYSIVLEYYFGYLTFHHKIFTDYMPKVFLESHILGSKLHSPQMSTYLEPIIITFYRKYVDFFGDQNFPVKSIGGKLQDIINLARLNKIETVEKVIDSINNNPYWEPLWPQENIRMSFYQRFGLQRESVKGKLEKHFFAGEQYNNASSILEFYKILIDNYLLSETNILETHILEKFLTAIQQETEINRVTYLIQILQLRPIEIPYIRSQIHKILVDECTELIQHKRMALEIVFLEAKKMPLIHRYAVIESLCASLVTQGDDARKAKSIVFEGLVSESNIHELDKSIFTSQSAVVLMADIDDKKLVIDFLMSNQDQDILDDIVMHLLAKDRKLLYANFMKQDSEKTLQELQGGDGVERLIGRIVETKDRDAYRALLHSHKEIALAEEIYSQQAKLYHQNFWSSPFWVRALLLDNLINNEVEEFVYDRNDARGQVKIGVTKEEGENYMYHKIVSSVLPVGSKYSASCRAIFDAYYAALESYEKTIFLSAIMAGAEKGSNQSDDAQLGSILAHILGSMGPAETKFGQAMHSYPGTPQEISKQLYRLKSHAHIPPMWDIRDMLEDSSIVPLDIRNDIVSIKAVFAGSIHLTLLCENTNGEDRILTIQVPNALPRIEEGFRLLGKVVDHLSETKNFALLAQHANTILGEAKHITKNELDENIMSKQYNIAQKLYAKNTISYGKTKVVFETPDLLAYGSGYKYITYLPGCHFNEMTSYGFLPEETKKDYAKIILFKELLIDFQGENSDKDRHGDNIRVDFQEGIVGNFDFGGLTLETQTDTQKIHFGNIVTQVYKKSLVHHEAGVEIFLNVIDEYIKEYPEERQYFARLQQRLLSLGDYFKLLKKEDIQEIMIGVLSQDIDQLIKKTIEDGVGIPLSFLSGMNKFVVNINNDENPQFSTPQIIHPDKNKVTKYDPLKDLL